MLSRNLALLLVLLLVAGVSLAACGSDDEEEEPATESPAAEAGSECREVEAPEPKEAEFKRPERVLKRGADASAVVETSCGTFEIALDTQGSPRTANSFAFLAREGFYDGLAFHRISPDFVIQGGDPRGTGEGGPGYSIDEPPPARTAYLKGVVAMAKNAVEPPGRSGSQFFVVTAPADAGLPPDYAVVGEVTEGMEVVERIDELGDPGTEQPLRPVIIESITIERR